MQGTLKEIDLCSILSLIELGQRTGELLIQAEAQKLRGKSWFIFFLNGSIIYATSTATNALREYLRGLRLQQALTQISLTNLSSNLLEYGQIWALLEANLLSPDQARKIIQSMVHEVIIDTICLHDATFAFDEAIALSPQLISIKFTLIAEDITKQTQHWQQLYQTIQSFDQCPTKCQIQNPNLDQAHSQLSAWIDDKTSIRQIAHYLQCPPIEIATIVFSEIKQGLLAIAPSHHVLPQPASILPYRITCIDDSITICRAVEYILHSNGYQVTSISNPVRALSLVFQLKPNLIFCDISMPELDGYEFCAMLRKSVAFSQIPIIMLTSKDGFIDRIRSRMVGATEYLTKPFKEKELLAVVSKYLQKIP